MNAYTNTTTVGTGRDLSGRAIQGHTIQLTRRGEIDSKGKGC